MGEKSFPGKRYMGKAVQLVEGLSCHVQCKLTPTVALLGMNFNLSSNSVTKFVFFKCYIRETHTHNLLSTDSKVHRDSEREIQDPQDN